MKINKIRMLVYLTCALITFISGNSRAMHRREIDEITDSVDRSLVRVSNFKKEYDLLVQENPNKAINILDFYEKIGRSNEYMRNHYDQKGNPKDYPKETLSVIEQTQNFLESCLEKNIKYIGIDCARTIEQVLLNSYLPKFQDLYALQYSFLHQSRSPVSRFVFSIRYLFRKLPRSEQETLKSTLQDLFYGEESWTLKGGSMMLRRNHSTIKKGYALISMFY